MAIPNKVIEIRTLGPQGPIGPQGPSGSGNAFVNAVGNGNFINFTTQNNTTVPILFNNFLGTTQTSSMLAPYVLNSQTSSFLVTASVALNTITFTKGDGSFFPITINTGSGGGGSVGNLQLVTQNGASTNIPITASIISASSGITGSLFGTASWAVNSISSSLATRNLLTASVTLNTITFTKGDGDEFNITVNTGSGGGTAGVSSLEGLTGTIDLIAGSGISITTSSNNITITNTGGGGSIGPEITGSLIKTASAVADTITFTKGDGTNFTTTITYVGLAGNADNIDIDNVSNNTRYGLVLRDGSSGTYQKLYADTEEDTPSWNPSTNTFISPIISASSFTGSLSGTSSWAINSQTASFLPIGTYSITASWAQSASNAINARTASFLPVGTYNITSSWAINALTASFVNPLTQSVFISGNLTITGSTSISGGLFTHYVDFNTISVPPFQEGRVQWTDDTKTINIDTDVNGFSIEVGHQTVIRGRNQTGFDFPTGVVVYISGGNNSRPLFSTASWENDANSAYTIGIIAQAINNNTNGYAITNGILRGINTSLFTAGDALYLSSSGQITNISPIAPRHNVRLGKVISSANDGLIHVDIDNGYEISELHDVVDTSTNTTFGALLVKSGSVWKDGYQLTGSYGLTGSLNATSFTGSLFGTASWATNASTASSTPNAITTASVNLNTITFKKGDTTEFSITVNTGSSGEGSIGTLAQVTALGASTTVPITASIISASSFTGSLFGTASYALNTPPSPPQPILFYFSASETSGDVPLSGQVIQIDAVPDILKFNTKSYNDVNLVPVDFNDFYFNQIGSLITLRATSSGAFRIYKVINYTFSGDYVEYTIQLNPNIRSGSLNNGDIVEFRWDKSADVGQITSGNFIDATNTHNNNSVNLFFNTSPTIIPGGTEVSTLSYTGSGYIAGAIPKSANLTISSLTSSLFGTSSWAANSSTASFTPNAITTASVSLNTITFTKGSGATFNITVDTGSGGGGGVTVTNGDESRYVIVTTGDPNTISGESGLTYGSNLLTVDDTIRTSYIELTSSLAKGSSEGFIIKYGGTPTEAGFLYYLSENNWLTSSLTLVSSSLLAIAITTNSSGGMLLQGVSSHPSIQNLTPGQVLYLSGSGVITPNVPTISGQQVRVVGYGLSGSNYVFNPSTEYVTLA